MQDFLPTYTQILTNDPSQLGWGVWLMIHTADSTLIGDLGFTGKPDESRTVEIGYEVLSAYRRQGYAFEAVEALVNWAFNQPEIARIIAHCPDDNSASIRILEKLGMQQIGRNETPSINLSKFVRPSDGGYLLVRTLPRNIESVERVCPELFPRKSLISSSVSSVLVK